MKSLQRLLLSAVLLSASASALALTTVYTSSAAFSGELAPGAYTESFDGLSDPPAGPAAFSGGLFSYSASAPSDIYLAGGFLGTSQIDEALTITFTSGNVFALGAEFFATDINDDPVSTQVTITLSDGTVETFTPTSFATAFRGFVSDQAITSLTISGPGQSLYAGLDNLTVGAGVPLPEPTSWMLAGLALAGLAGSRRRSV